MHGIVVYFSQVFSLHGNYFVAVNGIENCSWFSEEISSLYHYAVIVYGFVDTQTVIMF